MRQIFSVRFFVAVGAVAGYCSEAQTAEVLTLGTKLLQTLGGAELANVTFGHGLLQPAQGLQGIAQLRLAWISCQ